MSDDRPASVADIEVEELRKKEINGPIRLPKRDFFTRGQKLKVKDPWHILSGYDLEFAGMSTRERGRVMVEWFGRRQTIALPINSVVGCLIATILLMILSENNVRTPLRDQVAAQIGKTALDKRVLSALTKVPRHEFVPVEVQQYAYLNRAAADWLR